MTITATRIESQRETRRTPSPTDIVGVVGRTSLSYSRQTHAAALREVLSTTLEGLVRGYRPKVETGRRAVDIVEFMRGEGAKRLAHIVCDSFVRDSALEGSQVSLTSQWLLDNLQLFLPKDHKITLAIKQLHDEAVRLEAVRRPEDLQRLCEDHAKKIRTLPRGEQLLLLGGWKEDSAGHVMLYDIKRQEDERYSLNVYNTGAGSDLYHDLVYEKGKMLIRPMTSFSDMTFLELMGGDVDKGRFLQMLLEMRFVKRNLSESENARILYDTLLTPLHPFHKPGVPSDFATPQRAGTCAYRSLVAFVRSHLPLDEFKALQIRIKKRELELSFSSIADLSQVSREGAAARYLLKTGASALISRLIKSYRQGSLLAPKDLLHYLADANHLLEEVQKAEARAQKALEKMVPTPFPRELVSQHLHPLYLYRGQDKLIKAEEKLNRLPPRPGSTAEIVTSLGTRLPSHDMLSRTDLVTMVEALPAPAIFMSHCQTLTIEALHETLSNLLKGQSQFYHLAITLPDELRFTFEEKVAIFKFYALIHAAAVSLDKQLFLEPEQRHYLPDRMLLSYAFLDQYKVAPQFTTSSAAGDNEWLGFFPTSPTAFAKARALEDYFATQTAADYAIAPLKGPHYHALWEEENYGTQILNNPLFHRALTEECKKRWPKTVDKNHLLAIAMERRTKDSPSYFDEAGLYHLRVLKESATIAYSCFAAPFNTVVKAECFDDQKPKFRSGNEAHSYHPALFPDLGRYLSNHCKEPYEGDEQRSLLRSDRLSPLESELLRASHSTEASWHLMASALKDNLSHLENENIRSIFKILFFRRDSLEAMSRDKSLIPVAESLIKEGIHLFFTGRQTNPHLEPLLFLLDIALHLRFIFEMSFLPLVDDVISNLNNHFDRFKNPPLEAKAHLQELDLQRKLFFPEKKPTLTSIAASWTRFLWENGPLTMLRMPMMQRMHEALLSMDNELDTRAKQRAFIVAFFEELGYPLPPITTFNYAGPLSFTIDTARGPYRATIVTGSVHTPLGSLQGFTPPAWREHPDFVRFFGEEASHFRPTSSGISFRHPRMTGEFLVNCPAESLEASPLYCEIPDHGLCYYVKRQAIANVPTCLIYDHHHWISPKGTLLICEKESNTPLYFTNTLGLQAIDDKGTIVTSGSGCLTAIEDPAFILASWDKEGLKRVSYPRLALSFTRNKGFLVADFDDRYHLSLEPPKGVMGLFDNYLYLVHRKGGKPKVLIPKRPLTKLSFPTTELCLEITPPEKTEPTYRPTIRGTLSSFTFTLDKETLQCDNNEAILFLTLIHFQRKNYEEALLCLDELNRAEPLDITLLEMIVNHPDPHPEAEHVILKGATIIAEIHHRKAVPLALPAAQIVSYQKGDYVNYLTEAERNLRAQLANKNTLAHFIGNHCFPKKELATLWLTELTEETWPGFFPLYQRATKGTLVQKRVLFLQLRCLLSNPKLPLSPAKRFLLSLLFEVTRPLAQPTCEAKGDDFIDQKSPFLPVKALTSTSREEIDDELLTFMQEVIDLTDDPLSRKISYATRKTSETVASPVTINPRYERSFAGLVKDPAITALCTLDPHFFVGKKRGDYKGLTRMAAEITPEEAPFKEAILKNIELFFEDVTKGADLLSQEQTYTLAPEFESALAATRARLEETDRRLTEEILGLANKTGNDHETLALGYGKRKALSIEQLYYLFLQGHPNAFLQANSHLTNDILPLQQLIFNSLLVKTTLQQIDRPKIDTPLRAYDPLLHPHYLVFEYFTNIRLTNKQKLLLDDLQKLTPDGRFVSKIGQLMMGGGKTKVLSALLLFAASRPGFLPMLVVPSSLYNVVFADLSLSFRSNFNQIVYPIQLTRRELTLERLQFLEHELSQAMQKGQVILIKADSLQILRLQFLFEHEEALTTGVLSARGLSLKRLMTFLRKHSDILLDEVHLILAQKQEVNFPVGKEKLVESRYVDTIASLFLTLLSDAEIGPALQADKQGLISDDHYRKTLLPSLAQKFLTNHLVIPPDILSFEETLRYISGHEAPDVEAKLEAHYHKGRIPRFYANHLALVRYILNELLPKNFKKSCGRHFGPLPPEMAKDLPPGKIVPYQAVGTPATTVFASWVEETIYGFMTACRLPATPQLLDYVVRAGGELSLQTEFIQEINTTLHEITGYSLFELDDPVLRAKGLDHINKEISHRLRLQGEFLKLTVKYHDERLSSNPQDWDLPSIRGLSGTPYNSLCYTKGLSENVVVDLAVEGKIIATLLKKRTAPIHTPTTTEAGALLRSLITEENKDRVHGLQDPAGLFKQQDNLAIATAFNEVIHEKKLGLQGTLFFWKKPGMAAADQLAFLRVGCFVPIELKGSSRTFLEEQDIDPEKIFIYYDERRCTGTDLYQPSESLNFVTIDREQDITSTLQSILRLRQFVTGDQEIEFVIPHDLKMPKTTEGLLLHLVKNLAIDQAKQLYQALRQRINALFKESVLEELLESTTPVEAYKTLRALYVEKTTSDPFMAYGKIPHLTTPLLALEAHISDMLAKCPCDNPAFRAKVEAKIALFCASLSAEKRASLPAQVVTPSQTEEGTQVELALQAEQVQEQQVQQEIQLQQELIEEGHNYRRIASVDPLPEMPFPIAELSLPLSQRSATFTTTLATSIEQCPAYKRPYYQAFDSNIFVSVNFTNPSLPLFSPYHKPAHQILVEQTPEGEWRFLLISLAETDAIKTTLQRQKMAFWLINDHGDSLLFGQPPLPQNTIIQRALLQIAAFNGNAVYLQKHEEETAAWLSGPHELLKKQLIAIKAQNTPLYAEIIARSLLLNPSHVPVLPAFTRSPPSPPATPPRSSPLAQRLFWGTLALFSLPFALFGLLFTLPFTRSAFLSYWRWFITPFMAMRVALHTGVAP